MGLEGFRAAARPESRAFRRSYRKFVIITTSWLSVPYVK
jgi:hypothetical protein